MPMQAIFYFAAGLNSYQKQYRKKGSKETGITCYYLAQKIKENLGVLPYVFRI